jgi:hypothetical protein
MKSNLFADPRKDIRDRSARGGVLLEGSGQDPSSPLKSPEKLSEKVLGDLNTPKSSGSPITIQSSPESSPTRIKSNEQSPTKISKAP